MINTDEKLKYILEQAEKGKSPKELAEEMGYRNFGSLKNFMCNKGYIWNKETSKYIKGERRKIGKLKTNDSFRTQRVIAYFECKEEPKTIAEKLGFKDHKEMSEYMKNNGYEWSTKIGNYAKKEEIESRNISEIKELDKYIEILEILKKNYTGLEEALSLNPDKCIKKYRIPGINTIKSIQMASTLNEMSKEYSRAYNISQKHLFEIALIEFFRKYGFKKEVDHILKEEVKSQ